MIPNPSVTGGCEFFGTPGGVCRLVAGGFSPQNNCSGGLDLDNRRVGNQTILYVARDSVGNVRVARRVVIVTDANPPSLTLTPAGGNGLVANPAGSANVLATFSAAPFQYVDPGATSFDIVDGNVSFREVLLRQSGTGVTQLIELNDTTMAVAGVCNSRNNA